MQERTTAIFCDMVTVYQAHDALRSVLFLFFLGLGDKEARKSSRLQSAECCGAEKVARAGQQYTRCGTFNGGIRLFQRQTESDRIRPVGPGLII